MVQLDHKFSEAFGHAVLAYKAGRLEEAERLCQQILTGNDEFFDALYLLAIVQAAQGQKENALTSFKRALAVRPNAALALNDLGLLLHELKRDDEAVATYDRALALRPDFALAHFRRGNVCKSCSDTKRHSRAMTARSLCGPNLPRPISIAAMFSSN